MRRAGLDYHEYAGISIHENWADFTTKHPEGRFLGISTTGFKSYSEVQYRAGDFLIFGPETRGLPATIRDELGPENLLRIPMVPTSRSLNLSNATAILVYEAWRQLGFAGAE